MTHQHRRPKYYEYRACATRTVTLVRSGQVVRRALTERSPQQTSRLMRLFSLLYARRDADLIAVPLQLAISASAMSNIACQALASGHCTDLRDHAFQTCPCQSACYRTHDDSRLPAHLVLAWTPDRMSARYDDRRYPAPNRERP